MPVERDSSVFVTSDKRPWPHYWTVKGFEPNEVPFWRKTSPNAPIEIRGADNRWFPSSYKSEAELMARTDAGWIGAPIACSPSEAGVSEPSTVRKLAREWATNLNGLLTNPQVDFTDDERHELLSIASEGLCEHCRRIKPPRGCVCMHDE